MKKEIVTLFLVFGLIGCVSTPDKPQQAMSASYYNMKDESFSLQAIAPMQIIREYAICKAIWFAEKKNAKKIALSDPKYDKQPRTPGTWGSEIHKGWGVLDTTAYLTEPKSTQNPFINVTEKASTCSNVWQWYR